MEASVCKTWFVPQSTAQEMERSHEQLEELQLIVKQLHY